MKRWKKALSAFVVAAVMGFSLAATGCKKKVPEGGNTPHTEHTWSDWKTTEDGKGHYKETTCPDHGVEKGSEGNHADINPIDGKCDVCGADMTTTPDHNHTWSDWKFTEDGKGHYKETTCTEHAVEKGYEGNHVDTDPADNKCDTCNAELKKEDTPPEEEGTVISVNVGALVTAGTLTVSSKGSDGKDVEQSFTNKSLGAGIVLNASSKVTEHENTVGDVAFTHRIVLKSKNDNNYIKFTTVEASKIRVYVANTSSTDTTGRQIGLYNSGSKSSTLIAGTQLTKIMGGEAQVVEFTLSEAGEFYLRSIDNELSIYRVDVVYSGEVTPPVDEPPVDEPPAITVSNVVGTFTYTVSDGAAVSTESADANVKAASLATFATSYNPKDFKFASNTEYISLTLPVEAGSKLTLSITGYTGSSSGGTGITATAEGGITTSSDTTIAFPADSDDKNLASGQIVYTADSKGEVTITLKRSESKTARITELKLAVELDEDSGTEPPVVSKSWTVTVADGAGVVDGGAGLTVAYVSKEGSTTSANKDDFKFDGNDAKVTLTLAGLTAGQTVTVKVSGYTGSGGNAVGLKYEATNATAATGCPEKVIFDSSTTKDSNGTGTFTFTVDANGNVVIELLRSEGNTTRLTKVEISVA